MLRSTFTSRLRPTRGLRLLALISAALLTAALSQRASAATLLRTGFETSNPWTALAVTQQAASGTVTAYATYDPAAGTIDTYGTSTSSAGLLFSVNSSAATGTWTATLDSGVLSLLTANTRGLGFLTLSFSLQASSAYPVRVRIESYNSSSVRTGGLQTLIFPAAGDFYQRYALDLDKMTPVGAGAFVPSDPKIRIFFELDSTANGTGWPSISGHTIKIDNVNYSTPKYYVKPASIGGSNSNDGLTEATALATVQAAANKALTGDNIIAIMEDSNPGGEDYVENNFNFDMVNISKPGAPDAWIVFKNYPGHAPAMKSAGWNVFRICNNSSGGSAAYVEVRGLIVRGQSFVDANGDRQINPAYQQYVGLVDSRSNGNGISVDAGFNSTNLPHNVRVADCTMEYLAGGNGGNGDRMTFENNLIRYNAWWMRYAGSGISFGFGRDTEANAAPSSPTYRRLIRNNIVYGNECMVPWNRGTSNPYSDGNGIIIDSDTAGYTGKTLVQNNLVFNNGGSGIHVLKASNVDVVHNTAFFNSACTSQAYGQIFTQSFSNTAGQWVKNVRVTNNLMVAPRNPTGVNSYLYNESATSVASADPTTITHNRNIYIGGDVTPSLSGANLSNNTDLGRAYDPASLFVSPSIDPDVADFRLRAAAVSAKNYGSAVGYRGVLDLAGTPRPIAGTTDTGVYQTPANTTYPPVFSPLSGNYAAAQNVTLVSDTAGATIVYTTNGTTPAVDAAGVPTNGTLYTGAIAVSTATTLKAIAWKSGMATAAASTARYTFQDLSAVPVTLALQTPSGTYPGTLFIQPLTRTPGALIRYTTDTTNPTPTTGTPQQYTGITVTDYAEVRYIASKAGRANSPVVTGLYTVRASMGNLADGTALTTFGANVIRFVRVRTSNGFSAANIYARINGLTGNYRAAIYDDAAGVPTTRLAVSSLVTNPATGWVCFPLATRVTLSVKDSSNADKYYWLAIWSDNPAAGIYATSTGGTARESAATFSSTWPTPAGTNTSVAGTANYAIYAANQPPNLAPVVAAGPDQTIASAATATLAGTASDDGVPLAPGTLTTTWTQFSGPGIATFANPASVATTVTFSTDGTYVLRLTGRDALLTASDDVIVTVGSGGGGPLDTPPPAGVVRARFSDGAGTTWPQQYTGVAGDGWAGAWSLSANATAAIASVTPLKPASGNYVTVARTGGTGSANLAGIVRQWSETTRPTTQFSRLTFDFRLDSSATVFNSANESITLTARPVTGATSASDSTFFIRTFGAATGSLATREWGVYSGDGVNTGYVVDRFVPTGLVCVPGVTYTFTIDLYGASAAGTTGGKVHGTYDVTITDGTNTVKVLGSRFRSAAYSSGGYLSFSSAQDVATDNITFSVDSIEMTSLAPTTTTLGSSLNPANLDDAVTLTATVTGTSGNPAGTVTFLDGALPIGTGVLNGSGVATFTTSALSAGTHLITASYPETTGFLASSSAPLSQKIRAATLTTLSSNLNPADLGTSVTLSATVDTDNTIPAGSVTFFDGVTSLGSATLDGAGVATLSTSTLTAGSHAITAVYATNADFTGSTSEVFEQIIRRPTSSALVSSSNPANLGAPFTFTATLSASGATPDGSVTFFDGVTSLGSATLDGSGVATLTTSSLAAGSHSITAVYATTAGFTGSTSPAVTQTIRSAYDSWANANGLNTLGQAAMTDDPDKDGLNNLLEYALGGTPLVPSTGDLPALSRDLSGQLILTFKRDRAGLNYIVEGCTDLASWQTLATNPGTVGQLVPFPAPASIGAPRYFLRLRVVTIP